VQRDAVNEVGSNWPMCDKSANVFDEARGRTDLRGATYVTNRFEVFVPRHLAPLASFTLLLLDIPHKPCQQRRQKFIGQITVIRV